MDGAATYLENLLGKAIMRLACRHHIAELHIKHADEAVKGQSHGPNDAMFKKFRKCFDDIHQNRYCKWEGMVQE